MNRININIIPPNEMYVNITKQLEKDMNVLNSVLEATILSQIYNISYNINNRIYSIGSPITIEMNDLFKKDRTYDQMKQIAHCLLDKYRDKGYKIDASINGKHQLLLSHFSWVEHVDIVPPPPYDRAQHQLIANMETS